MDKFEKRWIRREFNKTNGMIFLYKILFGQLTFLIMMAMYRLFPVDEHFNDGAVWYLISGFLCLGIFVIWRRPSFFRTQIFPVHSHMSPGKFLSFFGIFMIAQNASSVLYVLMEMGAQHFGFTFARSLEAATGGSVTISMLLYSGFAAPLIEEFIFRGAVLKTLEPFRQVVRTFWPLTCLCSHARKFCTDSFCNGCRTDPWIYRYGILDLVQSPFAYFQQSDPGRCSAPYCRHNAWQQRKYPVQCDHQSARHPWNCAPASKIPLHSPHLQQRVSQLRGNCYFYILLPFFGILFTLSCIWSGFAGISPL